MRMRYFVAGALLIVGMVAIVQAQQGFRGGFGGGGPVGLVANKAVQEDLKLTEDQVTKVKEWATEFRTKSLEIMKDKGIDFKDFKSFQSEEGREKLAEANVAVSKEAYKELGDILKKDQIERLKQIERRRLGVNAFANAEVADALKLTDSQKTSVKGITGDFNKERREIFTEAAKDRPKGKGKGGFGGFDPETQKKIANVEKDAMGKIVDLLDDNQKKTWKELIGADFDLSKLNTGFGGNRGKNKKKDEE
jgi:hypothetical protein